MTQTRVVTALVLRRAQDSNLQGSFDPPVFKPLRDTHLLGLARVGASSSPLRVGFTRGGL